MDAEDRAYLKDLLEPIADDVAEIKVDVKDMRRDIGVLQRFRAQALALMGLVVIIFGGGTAWIALLR